VIPDIRSLCCAAFHLGHSSELLFRFVLSITCSKNNALIQSVISVQCFYSLLTYFISEKAGSDILGLVSRPAALVLSRPFFHVSNVSGNFEGANVRLKNAASGDLWLFCSIRIHSSVFRNKRLEVNATLALVLAL